jgi:hypothetical protein
MNQDLPPTHSTPAQEPEPEITIRIRRRPLYEWLFWLIWLILLAILSEFTLGSFAEQEPQAGITAGALFVCLLVAGLIVWAMQRAESHSPYRRPTHSKDDESRE